MEERRGRLRFANATFSPATGSAGDLALLWRARVNLVVSDFDNYLFDTVVNDAGVQWRLMCCYGPPYRQLHETF